MFICPVLLFHCLFMCSAIARRDERCLQNTLLKTLPTEATALVNFPLAFCFVLLQVLSLFPVPFAAWAAHEDSLFTYDSSDWLWITVEKRRKADGKMTLKEESKIPEQWVWVTMFFSFKVSTRWFASLTLGGGSWKL